MLVRYLAEQATGDEEDGIARDDLAQWYLEQKEDDLDGEEDYHREHRLVRLVLKRMVKVSVSIPK